MKLTMLGETLENGSGTHDKRAGHDRPSSAIFLVEPRSYRYSEDRSELVARGNKPKKSIFNGGLLRRRADVAIAKV